MYSATTNSIRVIVEPLFLADQSSPDDNIFVWAYNVRIENNSKIAVQLKSRIWKITDNLGQSQKIKGRGVVGQQPTLDPGDAFEYTSGVPLKSPSAIVQGSYKMLTEYDEWIDVSIPAFSLDSPFFNNTRH
ncbi:MAG: Co2+/Mg2+ efflux protein ApaG [Pseudomonadota bacterium]